MRNDHPWDCQIEYHRVNVSLVYSCRDILDLKFDVVDELSPGQVFLSSFLKFPSDFVTVYPAAWLDVVRQRGGQGGCSCPRLNNSASGTYPAKHYDEGNILRVTYLSLSRGLHNVVVQQRFQSRKFKTQATLNRGAIFSSYQIIKLYEALVRVEALSLFDSNHVGLSRAQAEKRVVPICYYPF